ncbi:sodium-dependent transporter [Clostridium lacusfryxellense]|uniref:sodium-dependent transporter n=1 Tax=Clostridium lacusfryxellense TaxID=205328 RepID=UPI001C0D2418|nr:sodium-dependent transporter [Clostridium lacusfryxellense]MBU3112272.1 sodium-dependent transporter [Clostridium lacusfryxellense]
MEDKNKRETFSTGFAVFFATLGSAVGLGNIWRFPYLTGANGGGAFLLAYLLCVALVGIPIMACEFYIGRKSRKNAVGAFKKLKAGKGWKVIGFMGVASAFLIMFFYSSVAGWVYSYVFRALKGDFVGVTATTAKTKFMTTLVGPMSPLVWQFIVLAVVSVILIAGVKNGIERITKTLMPVLFILIIICDVRALTLPGASQGLNFLFHVDFTQLTGPVILTALGLAFFKMSLGIGIMITYGSYFTHDNDMIATSAKVAISDSLVSILAGIAIFPAVFSFGMEPSAGPGLLFMTIPLVFSKIPFGSVLLVAFFLLTAIAATTAMMSIVQVPVAYFTEEKGMGRVKAVLLTTGIIMVVGVLATLSADSSSVLGNIHIIGKKGFFDSFDYLSSNILLPVGGLITAIYIGYFVKKEDFKLELSNQGTLNNNLVLNIVHVFIKFVSPVLLIIVFLNSIGVMDRLFK